VFPHGMNVGGRTQSTAGQDTRKNLFAAMLDERHATRQNGLNSILARIDQGHVGAAIGEDDAERQADVSAPPHNSDTLCLSHLRHCCSLHDCQKYFDEQ
jgi:hypothetical protein